MPADETSLDLGVEVVDEALDLRPRNRGHRLVADARTRVYSNASEAPDCDEVSRPLARLGAKRMVVGHTVQPSGISSACDGRMWRIDVGMSRAFGWPIQVLQIAGNDVTVLR